jgi:phenylacetate-CoA ligase
MVFDLAATWLRLQREQWLDQTELAVRQQRRLQRLLARAYRDVPFYRRAFTERGLTPADVASVADLVKLPLLTKAALQRGGADDLRARGARGRLVTRETSGSTGRPLSVVRSRREDLLSGLLLLRAYLANGVRPWHRQAVLFDQRRLPRPGTALDWLRRRRRVYLWSGQPVAEQLEALERHRPHVLRGFSQSLVLLARAIERAGPRAVRPRLVLGTAEQLDRPARDAIERALDVRMVDLYSTEEAGPIAWECPERRGYHLNSDQLVVEVVRGDGRPCRPGERGRVVVTPLFLHTMPLIRYDLGDVACPPLPERCPCGRTLPLLPQIQGRADDFVTLRSGTVVAPVGTFDGVLHREPSVLEYLVVQEDYDHVRVEVVARAPADPGMRERVRAGLAELLGHEAEVTVEIVPRVARGGKLRRVQSRVPLSL